MSFGDKPGNRSFGHWSVLAVVIDAVTVAPSGSGNSEMFVVFGDGERLAVGARGASRTQRATDTTRPELGEPAGTDRDRDPVRARDRTSGVIDAEVVAVELVITEFRVPSERPRFDQRAVTGVFEIGSDLIRTRNQRAPRARRVHRRARQHRSGRPACSPG